MAKKLKIHHTRPAYTSTEQSVYLKILSVCKVMFLLKYSFIFCYILWSFSLYKALYICVK